MANERKKYPNYDWKGADRKYNLSLSGKFRHLKDRAKRKNFMICSKEEFFEWYKKQPQKCYYCNLPFKYIYLSFKIAKDRGFENASSRILSCKRFQIDRKNSKEGYIVPNMVLCCFCCNKWKSNFYTAEEFKIIGQKIIKPIWKSYITKIKSVL
jgi:hypothetical protein